MSFFEVLIAILICAFMILFIISMIAAYTNHMDIKRLYKYFEVIKRRENHDYAMIQHINKKLGGDKNGEFGISATIGKDENYKQEQ